MVSIIRSTSLALLFSLALHSRAQTNPFESAIRAFEQADLRNPPPANSILFLGSSTIVGWTGLAQAFPRFNVLNRGFGGSQTSDVLFFYDRIVPPYQPPLIVFYEGDNDLASGKTVDQVFGDWTNFVARVQEDLPKSHILFVAVKPSPSRAGLLARQRELNERVREQAQHDPRLHFADVFNPMLNASGQPRPELFVSDQLHLNAAGYEVWESVVVPAVEVWAAEYPVNVLKPEQGALMVDFGSPNSLSGEDAAASVHWNNVTSAGTSNSGSLATVVAASGAASSVSLHMVSRFNGANENGTAAAEAFPATATRDSLFGNIETFSGLANVTPIFRLAGLDPQTAYRFEFYASRLGVSDNRETIYTVAGDSTGFAILNAANNVESIAVVPSLLPESSGQVTISLTPGPNNNNANHFTYLGVLRITSLAPQGPVFLFDFGSSGSITSSEAPASGDFWNNLTTAIGTTSDGTIEKLLATSGAATEISLSMVSRFNGANENGTAASTNFPPSATRDSLFGNTALFGGLENVWPAFKLSGLNPAALYTFTFFGSRTGVSDNRETRYTVAGQSIASADLNAANNVEDSAAIGGIRPDANSEIVISLAPGPNNDNANRFTYLSLLRVDWIVPAARPPLLGGARRTPSLFRFVLRGELGVTYRIQTSADLRSWTTVRTVTVDDPAVEFELPISSPSAAFFRARQE